MSIQGILSKFIIFIITIASFHSNANNVDFKYRNDTAYLTISLNPTQKIYWRESGKIGLPTIIRIDGNHNLKDYKIVWPWPEFKKESKYISAVYKKDTSFPIYFNALDKNQPIDLKIFVKYLLCDESCTPVEKTFEMRLEPPFYWPDEQINHIEHNIFIDKKVNFEFTSNFPKNLIKIVMVDDSKKIHLPSQLVEIEKNRYRAEFSLDNFLSKTDNFNVEFFLNTTTSIYPFNIKISEIQKELDEHNILLFVLMGFIGGFILNLMPCVLPVLSLKLMSFSRGYSGSERKIHSLIASLTIILYFWVIAFITSTAKNLGDYFLAGFSLQNYNFILLILILLIFIIGILQDKFSLSIPNFLLNKISGLRHANRFIETIIITLVSTILATPCTAPFLASSVTFAISTNTMYIFIIFTSISIGFSFPYIMVMFYPNIINFLPKPGKWQNLVKKFFSFLVFLTISWLILILYSQLGIMPTLAVSLMLILLKFFIDLDYNGRLFRFLSIFFIIILIFITPPIIKDNQSNISELRTANWQEFDPDELENYLVQDRVVLINITADWCINCKILKFFVLDTVKTNNLLKKYHVTTLMGDITKENKKIHQFLKDKNSPGLPYNIVYGPNAPEGIVLPTFFNYNDLENAIKKSW